MAHIGKKLSQLIDNQYGSAYQFAQYNELERQGVYQDLRREDLNTRRLRIYLPLLKTSFSEFFKNFENEGGVKEELQKRKKTSLPFSLEAEALIKQLEERLLEKDRIIEEKDKLIASKEEIIDLLKKSH